MRRRGGKLALTSIPERATSRDPVQAVARLELLGLVSDFLLPSVRRQLSHLFFLSQTFKFPEDFGSSSDDEDSDDEDASGWLASSTFRPSATAHDPQDMISDSTLPVRTCFHNDESTHPDEQLVTGCIFSEEARDGPEATVGRIRREYLICGFPSIITKRHIAGYLRPCSNLRSR